MIRRAFLTGLVAGVALAGPALASEVVDGIIRQLKSLGFRSIVQERTLLGRVRITANRKDGSREIIVNPRTGEILRDLWTALDGRVGATSIINETGGSGGHGGGSDEDDDDDDDDDERESGNNSGSGGSGGSGSSGSGSGDDKDKD